MNTQEEAHSKICAIMSNDQSSGFIKCRAAMCMHWTWVDDAPARIRRHQDYRGEDRWTRTEEPERPAHVPAEWPWHPAVGDYDDSVPGHWRETEVQFDQRTAAEYEAALETRKGVCGLGQFFGFR